MVVKKLGKDYERNKSLTEVVVESLGDFVKRYEEYGNVKVTMEVRDVNAKVKGMDLMDYILNALENNGFNAGSVKFFFRLITSSFLLKNNYSRYGIKNRNQSLWIFG